MLFTVADQTRQFLFACLLGVGLGVVYDGFRAVRVILPHGKTMVFAEDIIFTSFFGLCFFVYSAQMANFSLRGFIFIGMILGFVTYLLTVGVVVITVIKTVYKAVYTVFSGAFKLLYRLFLSPIVNFFVSIGRRTGKQFVHIKSTFIGNKKSSEKNLQNSEGLVYNDKVGLVSEKSKPDKTEKQGGSTSAKQLRSKKSARTTAKGSAAKSRKKASSFLGEQI